MFLSRLVRAACVAGFVVALAVSPSPAQVPSNPPPYNIDLGALITNALRTAGTVNSTAQANTNWVGVECAFVQTASSGSPSTTFSIQQYDAASQTWLSILTSDAIVANPSVTAGVPWVLQVRPGIQTSTLPTNMKAINLALPRTWRVSQTVGSGAGAAGPAVTGTIGCNYLK